MKALIIFELNKRIKTKRQANKMLLDSLNNAIESDLEASEFWIIKTGKAVNKIINESEYK